MAALFVSPLSFSVVSANQNSLAPATQAGLDEPALTWRSSNLTTVNVILDMGTSASYDTVALIGTNLRASDTVQVQTGATNTGTGTFNSGAVAAFSGSAISGTTAKCIFKLGSTRAERYIRIDITSTSNPAGYVEAQRIVIGKSLSLTNGAGLDLTHSYSFADQSVPSAGNGWRNWDRYSRLPQLKMTLSLIGISDFIGSWFGFLSDVGQSKAFLVVPDDSQPANWQAQALFGTIVDKAEGAMSSYNMYRMDLSVLAMAP